MPPTKLLKQIPILSGLKTQELDEIAKISLTKKVATKDIIFKEREDRRHFFIALSGKIKIYKMYGDEPETLAIIKPPQFFSELSLFDPKGLHTHAAQALEDSEVLQMPGRLFIELQKKNLILANKILNNITSNLSERLHHANNKIITLYRTGRIISQMDSDIKDLSLKILKTLLEVIKATKALFLSYSNEKDAVSIIASVGFTQKELPESKLSTKDPILGKIFEAKNIVNIKPSEYLLQASNKVSYIVNSALGVPLKSADEIIGIILLIDREGKDGFSTNNEILMEIVARQIESAIAEAARREELRLEEELERVYVKPI